MLPRTLRNFSLFVDGRGYAGRVTEMNTPAISIATEEFRAGGLDVPAEIDMGMEALELSFTLAEYDPDVLNQFGLIDQNAVRVTARGALMRNGENAVSIVMNATGHIKEYDPGAFEAGAITEAAFTMGLRYYRLEVAGGTVHEIDVENMTRVINGADQLTSIRAAMGI